MIIQIFSFYISYIFIFVLGFAMLTLPLGFIITICCFIADCWSIFFTGLPMTFALIAKYRRKKISKKTNITFSHIQDFFRIFACLIFSICQ